MTDFSTFTDDDQDFLAGLLYRAGIWISHAEDDEGEEDDEREMEALEAVLASVARRHAGEPFIQGVAKAALERRDRWPDWEDGVLSVLQDCPKAIALLKRAAPEKTVKAYKGAVMEIAVAVARAYGEFAGEKEAGGGLFGALVEKIVSGFSGLSEGDAGHPMNVSPAENTSLSRLAAALKIREDK